MAHTHRVINSPIPTNEQFLQIVFRQEINKAHVTVFHEDPNLADNRKVWAGGHWGNIHGRFTQGGNQYYTISTFHSSPDGVARRRKDLFNKTYVIVIDDVGRGPSAKVDPLDPRILPPTFAIETSPDNCQYGYVLSSPEANGSRVVNLLDGMVAAGIAGGDDPGMKGLTRYVRLPEGTNNKNKYIEAIGHPFQCNTRIWEPFKTFTLEKLAEPFGIDLDLAVRGRDFVSDVESEGHPSYDALVALDLIKAKLGPNNFDITCPWVEEHTGGADDGTAITLYPDGKCGLACHHGHGEDKRGMVPIMSWLYDQDPTLEQKVMEFWGRAALAASEGVQVTQPPAQPLPGPVTIDNGQDQPVDVMRLCEDLHFNPPQEALAVALSHVAATPDGILRETYIHVISDKTQVGRPAIRARINEMRQASSVQESGGLPFIHVNEAGNPMSTRDNASIVALKYGFTFKLNLMSRRVETIRDLSHVPADVRELAHLTDFEDLCMQHGLDDSRVQKHRDRIAFDNAYHPFVDYLTQERVVYGPWRYGDLDWITILAKSLHVSPEMMQIRDTLLKRWLISVVAAAHMRDEGDYTEYEVAPPAPRGVLVLQGPQNMGKTSWFNTITPDGMYKEGLQINHGDMNHMKTATNRLVVEIGEADHVTSGRMANYMKTIIGRSVDEVRLAFQKEEVRMIRRNVFCATVNPAEFLSDDQNTRWWTIDLQGIGFEQLAGVDIRRLWQQVYTLWLTGERYHLTRDEMDILNTSNERFRSMSYFEQAMIDTYDFDTMDGQEDPVNWKTTKEIVLRYATTPDITQSEMRKVLIRLTGGHNSLAYSNGVKGRYWRLPKLISMPNTY